MVSFGENVLVPLAAFGFIFGLPTAAFVFFRMMAHRERLEMIRAGIAPGGSIPKSVRASAARTATPYTTDAAHTTLRKGITLAFIGLAITIGLSFIGYDSKTMTGPGGVSIPITTWEPGPWLLGGLIPMFVGFAQVVTALLSGATLRPAATGRAYAPGPDIGAPPPPREPVTFDGPYTYRPGTTQELRPPTAPPERRS